MDTGLFHMGLTIRWHLRSLRQRSHGGQSLSQTDGGLHEKATPGASAGPAYFWYLLVTIRHAPVVVSPEPLILVRRCAQVLQDFCHGGFGFDRDHLAAARLEFDFAFGK